MESTPRGKVLIINNEYFNHPEFPNRNGTQAESRRLFDLFQNILHFDVRTVYNCTAEQMHSELKSFSQDEGLHDVDCCVVAILSHGGQEDIIYGVDGHKVNGVPQTGTFIRSSEIQAFFTTGACPAMRNKPKLFIGQFCRGVLEDTLDGIMHLGSLGCDVVKDNCTPSFADMFFLYATVSKFVAYRGQFVQTLCEIISKYACSRHIKDMATLLHSKMAQLELGRYVTISEERGTLRKNWFFNPPPTTHVMMV
ncbi:hypothetical protein BaRGS_00022705 [Batillaria attramentaria]|uniref:Caspase family p20 domain-containing protein n=1 Tax=Batillaria attramentaria TaxID=370345 RepID=A0ABD0KGK0_9CAEN